jgi:hypothetical protein
MAEKMMREKCGKEAKKKGRKIKIRNEGINGKKIRKKRKIKRRRKIESKKERREQME